MKDKKQTITNAYIIPFFSRMNHRRAMKEIGQRVEGLGSERLGTFFVDKDKRRGELKTTNEK
jgi:hypothetical protein